MRRNFFVVLVVLLAGGLTGCSWQKKSTATVSSSTTQVPQSVAEATIAPSADGSATSLTDTYTQDTTINLTFDSAKVTEAFDQAYQEAYADANATLKGKAKFCNILAEISPTEKVESAKLSFFFISDDQADWYWIGQKDQLQDRKVRLFAAKRDFTQISCSPATTDQLNTNYADALKIAAASGKDSFSKNDLARIEVYLQNSNWKVDAWKTDSSIISQTASIAGQAAAASATATSTAATAS